MNLAINGFGRIGRQCFRIICENHPDIKVVLINDLSPNDILAHLLEYDSAYGHVDLVKKVSDEKLVTKHGEIRMTEIKDPAELPHKEMKVDVVLECTGVFRKREGAQKHIDAGAKKVIISAPGKDEIDGTFVMGVNHEDYKPDMNIISNASCTTNCLAPMAKVIHENFTIQQGFMTTIHSWTASQKLVDGPDKDWRRARSAMNNLIPTTTGAAKAVGLVLPDLQGKLDGMAIRTPTLTGSITDLTCIVEKEVIPSSAKLSIFLNVYLEIPPPRLLGLKETSQLLNPIQLTIPRLKRWTSFNCKKAFNDFLDNSRKSDAASFISVLLK